MNTSGYIYIKTLLLFVIALVSLNSGYAQASDSRKENEKATSVANLLASKSYVFKARQAQPTGGRTVQLNTDFDLRLLGDTVEAYLPYYGRAFSAPIGSNEGGIRFTSTNFDYKQTELRKRKGGWNIVIEPKDNRDVRQLILYVFGNGSASLQVISNNRQQISYNGVVQERR